MRDKTRTGNWKTRFIWIGFFLVYMLPNQDWSFSNRLHKSNYLDHWNNWDFCDSLIYSLSNRSLGSISLNGGSNRSDDSSKDAMRENKKLDGKFCISMILLSIFSIILFSCLAIFSFVFKSCNILVIIWKIRPNFSSHICKDFYSCKMISIFSNMALIIACKRISFSFRLVCIIWTYPI